MAEIAKNCWKCLKMAEMAENDWKWLEIARITGHGYFDFHLI